MMRSSTRSEGPLSRRQCARSSESETSCACRRQKGETVCLNIYFKRPTHPTRGARWSKALRTVSMRSDPRRALWALRTWLDSWSGIGDVVVGMHRQGFDLQLTQYDDRGWRATFYATGMEHSATSATGTAWRAHPVARDAAGGAGGVDENP